MQKNTLSLQTTPSSWVQVLAGILPFVIVGPLTILLAYPYPYPEYRREVWWTVLAISLYILPLLLGLVIGARKSFPAWSYSYSGTFLSLLALAIAMLLVPVVFENNREFFWSLWFQIPFNTILIWLVSALVLWLARSIRFLSPIHEAVRSDWTLLSFALCMIPTFFSSQIDHSEEPVLTVGMFFSTVFLVLGALAYLLSRTRRQRFLSLLGGLALAVVFRLLDGNLVMPLYLLWASLVALAPSLLLLLRSPAKTVPQSA